MLNINLNFSYDTEGFFNDHKRREPLIRAAEMWSDIISDDFQEVPEESSFEIWHPSKKNKTVSVIVSEKIDDLLIFIGARDLPGSTLALGGPSGYSLEGDIFQARISDDFRGQGATTDYEPWAGVLSFDTQTNWNFSLDSPSLSEYDLLTVALHEIAHVLGIGTSSTFQSLTEEGFFVGNNSKFINGNAPIPLTSDEAHVEDGFDDNHTLMDPSTAKGSRQEISVFDKAILSDIGYEIDGFEKRGVPFPVASKLSETITGTPLVDVIDALAGNDVVLGGKGNDILKGGAGSDEIQGAEDDDRIYGGVGDDLIFGDAGDDVIFGDEGDDQLNGGIGSDVFVCKFGTEDIWTGVGEDTVVVLCEGNVSRVHDFDFEKDKILIIGSELSTISSFFSSKYREFTNYWTFDLPNSSKLYVKDDADMLREENFNLQISWDLEVFLGNEILIQNVKGDFLSTSSNEKILADSNLAQIIYRNINESTQGKDTISNFDKDINKVIFDGYDSSKILISLNENGDDYFEFNEVSDGGSLTIKNESLENELTLNVSKDLTINFIGEEIKTVQFFKEREKLTLSETLNFYEIEIDEISEFSSQIKSIEFPTLTNPIDLNDVLVQLKHIVGLRELSGKALAAADCTNDGVLNLQDVLTTLKHIVGLRPISSFDLVTENGFAVNNLTSESVGELNIIVNGDADQSYSNWELV